jgi:hypothetical protein
MKDWMSLLRAFELAEDNLMMATSEMFELLYMIRGHIDSTCCECESKAIVPEIGALLDKIEGGEA